MVWQALLYRCLLDVCYIRACLYSVFAHLLVRYCWMAMMLMSNRTFSACGIMRTFQESTISGITTFSSCHTIIELSRRFVRANDWRCEALVGWLFVGVDLGPSVCIQITPISAIIVHSSSMGSKRHFDISLLLVIVSTIFAINRYCVVWLYIWSERSSCASNTGALSVTLFEEGSYFLISDHDIQYSS